ncbi:MAG TPA: gluconate 2-dehydrogenase subunit 3 family protein [Acidobacteriota bacterium]|jgi:hypothetical protein
MSEQIDEFSRREALRRLAVMVGLFEISSLMPPFSSLYGEHVHRWLQQSPESWKPQVFNAHQNELVAAIAEMIIPETSTPGARKARVNEYIDTVLTEADSKDTFLQGLSWIDDFARRRTKTDFLGASTEQRAALLAEISDLNDTLPPDLEPGRRFFNSIKGLTIVGYYTSEPGLLEELNYTGNSFNTAFPAACRHEEHG